jgi:magnesium transporter
LADAPNDLGAPDRAPIEMAAAEQGNRRALAELIAALGDNDGLLLQRLTADLHPADAADLLEQLSWEQFEHALAIAPRAFTPEILAELNDEHREEALALLPARQLAEAVTKLDSDDATLLVEQISEERRDEVLAEVSPRDRAEVLESLSFDEETAGRLMQREFVAAPEHWKVGDVIDHLREAGEDELPDSFFEIYVVDPAFHPVGAVTLSTLLRARRDTELCDIMHELRVLISPQIDQEEAAYLFAKYHLAQAPVVDDSGRLKGMLTVDDIVDVIREESAEDMLAMAGVSEGSIASTAVEQVRARAPWLYIHLGTALMSSLVISFFEGTIERLIALAVLMPMVSALGGSAGGQSLAMTVHSLASRQLTDANARRAVTREAATAVMNGVIVALALAAVSYLWFRDISLSLVIGAALTLNIFWGGILGILVPLTLKRLRVDPAVASNVFVAAAADMMGFFLFLGLATVILL